MNGRQGMKRVMMAVWVVVGMVAAAVIAGDDGSDNEAAKCEGRG
jgi:hypothetical protein